MDDPLKEFRAVFEALKSDELVKTRIFCEMIYQDFYGNSILHLFDAAN